MKVRDVHSGMDRVGADLRVIAGKIVNRQGAGCLLDIVLGIVGAFVGGIIFTKLGVTGVTGFNLWSMFVAIVGAVIVLVIYHAIFARRVY